ncbi:MAG: hypothetical protein OEZ14_03900 [Acidimicrobiia bacterium]|nr:hypothetical protein [Acidimicrobiia bacterium]MDH5519660.1 hypothetical protein [Acidimicrobiia bacterium]
MTESDHIDPHASPVAGDDLLTGLKAANPVSVDDSPLRRSEAETLLDRITSRSGGFTPFTETQAGRTSAEIDPSTSTRTDERGRRWPLLAAVAAVAVLLVGAIAVFAPAGTQPALAVVQSAAQDTADARSGRVITVFDVVGREDADHEALSGSMTAAFADDDFAVTLDLDPSSTVMSETEAAELANAETRLVDGRLYATTDGERWMAIEAPEILQSTLARLTDLRTILAQVEELVEVETVGSSQIDGLAVTHYRSEVDLADQTLAESGWLPGAQGTQGTPVDIDAQGLVTVDLYVDAEGLMRRIEVSGQAEPVDDTIDASADFTVTTNFVDLDTDIVIEAPDPALVETLDFGAGGGLSGLDD